MSAVFAYAKDRSFVARRKYAAGVSERRLRATGALWRELHTYLERSRSTGCSYTDYWYLYRAIRLGKPKEVLECGTGVSTLVIAHALMENAAEGAAPGRITSMEEHAEWLEMSKALLPQAYHTYVDFRLSPTVEDYYSLFRGVRYRDVPEDRAYDFVFVDGPSYVSPVDGTPTFDLDLLHVLQRSDSAVAGLVDKRVSSCFVFQQLLGSDKVRYSPVLGIGFVAACTRADLGGITRSLSSANFEDSFRLLGPTRLSLSPRSS